MNKVAPFAVLPFHSANYEASKIILASVKRQLGKDVWLLETNRGSFSVLTTLSLVPGQSLRLGFLRKTENQHIYQLLPNRGKSSLGIEIFSHLFSCFMKRGMTLLEERLRQTHLTLRHWVMDSSTAKDWAVNKVSKRLNGEEIDNRLFPWVWWEAEVEKGNTPPFPARDEELWDLWNAMRDQTHEQWITVPFHFFYQEQEYPVLLHALIDPILNRPRFWKLTTTAFELPLCLHSQISAGQLYFKLILFRKKDFDFFSKYTMFLKQNLPSYVHFTIVKSQQEKENIVEQIDEHI